MNISFDLHGFLSTIMPGAYENVKDDNVDTLIDFYHTEAVHHGYKGSLNTFYDKFMVYYWMYEDTILYKIRYN